MSPKTTLLSVRLSDEDAAFLAGLEVRGATTLSDKMRALLAEARDAVDARGDAASAVQRLQREFAPTVDAVRRFELETGHRSALLAEALQRVPELAGLLIAGPVADSPPSAAFSALEARVADRAIALLEGLLRLAVTRTAPCYAPDVVAKRIDPVLELGTVILHHRSSPDRSSP
jgi:hypothetical protein